MKPTFPSAFSPLALLAFLSALAWFTAVPSALSQTSAGYALSFDGTDDHVVVPHTNALNAYPLTVTAWIKTTQTNGGAGIVNKYVSGSANGYQLFLHNGEAHSWYFRDLNNRLYYTGTQGQNGGFVADGEWHHLAYVVNDSYGRLYVDGTLKAYMSWIGSAGAPTTTQEVSFALYPASSGPDTAWFNGLIDEVAIWNMDRSAEIQATLNLSLSGTEPGLLGYWRLDEGTNSTAHDATFNGRDGTLVNGPSWVISTAPIQPGPPWILTPPPGVTPVGATLQGRVNPLGSGTVAWFEWGTTTNYGNLTSVTNLGGSSNLVSFSQGITGLAPEAVYHYRLMASNEFGLAGGRHVTFSTPAIALVSTLSVTNLSPNQATLQGTVNPLGTETFAWFEWGTTTNHRQFTALTDVGSGTSAKPVSCTVTGLAPECDYDFQLVGINQFGLVPGELETFTTPPAALVTTLPATQISLAGATLRGTANPLGADTFAWFEWGATTNYGRFTTVTNLGSGSAPVSVNGVVAGLAAEATYHFRLAVSNEFGLVYGQVETFVAPPAALATTLPITQLTPLGATLQGSVDLFGAQTFAWFEWGTTTNYGQFTTPTNLVSGTYSTAVSEVVASLTPETAYHFRLVVSNAFGLVWGQPETFTTPPPLLVVTLPATELTPVGATLQGTVNPLGAQTLAWFEWGATTNYGQVTAPTNAGSGTVAAPISCVVTSTAPESASYFRLVASNEFGMVWGQPETFTTPPAALVITLPATNLTPTTATLQGTVNPPGVETFAGFEWGATTNYGSLTALTNLGGGTNPLPVSAPLTGLVTGTQYHYRIMASNTFGLTSGAGEVFVPSVFTDIQAGLQGVQGGCAIWGDADNDGDLDIFVMGGDSTNRPFSLAYRNNGDGTFTDLEAGLPGLSDTSFFQGDRPAAWGDVDNDGDLDLVFTGLASSSERFFLIYRNNRDGTFTDFNTGLPGVYRSSVDWCDADNDGDLDLALVGQTEAEWFARVYRNNSDGTFSDLHAGLPGVLGGSVAWGDMDNDGDADLALTGFSGSGYISHIYRNEGNGVFTNLNAGLPGVNNGSVTWGDLDNDGDLDLALTGTTGPGSISTLYRNEGNGVFTSLNVGLPGVAGGSVAWGDFDNDGDSDLALMGSVSSSNVARIYRNDGAGTFVDIGASLPGVMFGSVAWGDFDNDGDLDLLLTGSATSGYPYVPLTRVYRNHTMVSNTPPSAPAGLRVEAAGDRVTLRWEAAQDTQTPSAALTYNVRAGTTPGGHDIVSPQAGPAGRRLLPARGNAQFRLALTLTTTRIPLGQPIYWSVQAVDSGFAGSSFATEATFQLTGLLSPPSGYVPGDTTGDGVVDPTEFDIVRQSFWQTHPPQFDGLSGLGEGSVQFSLTNSGAAAFTVLASTNLVDWEELPGLMVPTYQWLDPEATNYPMRFYRLRWP